MAIKAKDLLDRMAFRQANRDAVSLPAHVIAAGELASGRLPLMAFAANWLRNNQMKAGIWADQLASAIRRGDAPSTMGIMTKLGLGTEAWNAMTSAARADLPLAAQAAGPGGANGAAGGTQKK
jgi:hypothetical protein